MGLWVRTIAIVGLGTLAGPGCGVSSSGGLCPYPLSFSYPFDGERTWVYRSTDPTAPFQIIATSTAEPERQRGGEMAYRVPFREQCADASGDCVEGRLVHAISWSSPRDGGVAVHAIDVGAGIEEVWPPIRYTDWNGEGCEQTGSTETETGGQAWKVDTEAQGAACPDALELSLECKKVQIESDGPDGFPLAGTWWSSRAIGIVAFQRAGEEAMWVMADVDCVGACDGRW